MRKLEENINQGGLRVKKVADLLENVGKIRDGILVGASLLYLTGYAVWALIAWKYGLGPLPVFDVQYFVAGLPILLIVIVCTGFLRGINKFLVHRWPAFMTRRGKIFQKVSFWIYLIATLSGIVVFFVFIENKRLWPIALAADLMVGVIGLFYLHSDVYIFQGIRPSFSFFNKLYRLSFCFLIVCATGVLVIYYITSVYVAIPQEFGGAKPRLAQIDVKTKELSRETMDALGIQERDNEVARSPILTVIFAGSGNLFFKAYGCPNESSLIELPRSATVAITWKRSTDTKPTPPSRP